MKKLFSFVKDRLLGRHLEFRVRQFNVLAMAGALISLSTCALGMLNAVGILNVALTGSAAILSFTLLLYSYRSGRYQRCYMITVIVVFLGLFPVLFFSAGGYHSGMPSFFIFAVLFTIFMLDGKKVVIMSVLELTAYVAICLIAYRYPQTVIWFATEEAFLSDVIIAFVSVSLSLGICLFLHFRMYNRQQRDLRKSSEAKSRFLANMSHEIRTPINVMLGLNEVILRESDSARIKEYSRSVESAGRSLMALINNILNLSTIEKGKLELKEERYETAGLVAALSLIGEEYAKKRGLRFTITAAEGVPRLLVGDETHIRQIVSNFLSNAAKYTEKGGFELSFSSRWQESAEEVALRIAVADTGIGIATDNIPHLFDAFTRADTQENRTIEGSGLGLALAKEFADMMGGHIEVESQPGKGSVFTLELLQKVADRAPMGQWKENLHPAAAKRETFFAPGCHLLIVDDNRDNLQVMKALLSRTQLHMDTAMSGAECLDAVQKRRYDAILMDYMMPRMDGIETLKRLKERPGFDTPVIALTANVVAGVREKLLGAGFCQFLSKPVMWRDLEAALLAVLPRERVTVSAAEVMQIPAQAKDELARALAVCGVALDDGLRYAGGDIRQYRTSAEIFAGAYQTGIAKIRGCAGQEDWAGMKYHVHALKGNAGNLGANALSGTAAKTERLCVSGDGAYIAATLPALYLEWERARDGLAAFTAGLDTLLPEQPKGNPSVPCPDQLLEMLKFNQYSNAMDALAGLIEAGGTPGRVEALRDIRQKTEQMKFREAERLLTVLMESGFN